MLDYLANLKRIDATPDDSWAPDDIGYFVIRSLKDGRIRAEHYTSADEVTTIIVGACAEDVRKCILREFPTFETGHYGYICQELALAQVLKKDYVQS